MKRFLPYILIFTILTGVFTPLFLGVGNNKNSITLNTQVAEAANQNLTLGSKTNIKIDSDSSGIIKATILEKDNNYIYFDFAISKDYSNTDFKQIGSSQSVDYSKPFDINNPIKNYVEFKDLSKDRYILKITATDNSSGTSLVNQENKIKINITDSNTSQSADFDTSAATGGSQIKEDPSTLPACGFGVTGLGGEDSSVTGCAANILYYVLYVPTSWLFGGAGMLFDLTFDYSVDAESYKTPFVTEGWKIVRDLCNVFFIFILLYVAFAMILGLQNVKAKEMMINVVIIGLLINFSLFFTQVVIDSGNILARVFYNSETIKEKTSGNTEATIGGFGLAQKSGDEISLSSGVVSQVNPQNIVRHANKISVSDSEGNSATAGEESGGSLSAGRYILVIILAIIVNLVGTFVFISIALIFIARVIGLWLAMIFAPFAFLSYIIPSMASGVKMVGWKDWWSNLIGLSFLAPIFMFMLYLIILFLGKDTFKDLLDPNSTGPKFIIKTIMAFAFVMILLMKAKDLAKEYSGSIGEKVIGGINKVAGVAGGVALGAGAVALRGTVGRAGSVVANSDRLKRAEAAGGVTGFLTKNLRNIGKTAGSGSMDLRGAKVFGKGITDVGSVAGKAKEGGFEKMKEVKIEERVKRSKELETAVSAGNRSEADDLEIKLRQEKAAKATALAEAEKRITSLREKMQDQSNAGMDVEAKITYVELEKAKADKDIIKGVDPITKAKTAGGISDLESRLNIANDKINKETIDAMDNYASSIEGWTNKTFSYITSFGQHSGKGANIAAERIRKGVKLEETKK